MAKHPKTISRTEPSESAKHMWHGVKENEPAGTTTAASVPDEPSPSKLNAGEPAVTKAVVESWKPGDPLRTDGPTLKEYVEAGYAAENYPPQGYAKREAHFNKEPIVPVPPAKKHPLDLNPLATPKHVFSWERAEQKETKP